MNLREKAIALPKNQNGKLFANDCIEDKATMLGGKARTKG
jgi:hypothetical protein